MEALDFIGMADEEALQRAADALVRNVIAAMDRRLQTLSWMAPATRERARAKRNDQFAAIIHYVPW